LPSRRRCCFAACSAQGVQDQQQQQQAPDAPHVSVLLNEVLQHFSGRQVKVRGTFLAAVHLVPK
jgi:hypothetical protein